jgi:hypothetical protein
MAVPGKNDSSISIALKATMQQLMWEDDGRYRGPVLDAQGSAHKMSGNAKQQDGDHEGARADFDNAYADFFESMTLGCSNGTINTVIMMVTDFGEKIGTFGNPADRAVVREHLDAAKLKGNPHAFTAHGFLNQVYPNDPLPPPRPPGGGGMGGHSPQSPTP